VFTPLSAIDLLGFESAVRRWWVFIVRRLLLPRTHQPVYYEVNHEAGVVMIIAVWGAPRGRSPTL